MGMACLIPNLYSFFMKLDEEALLKDSLKNLHWFQSFKLVFLKNGCGRDEIMGHAHTLCIDFISGSFAESFTQNSSLVSKLQNSTAVEYTSNTTVTR